MDVEINYVLVQTAEVTLLLQTSVSIFHVWPKTLDGRMEGGSLKPEFQPWSILFLV